MLDFIELELTEVPDDLTCTQLLQPWHVPSCEDIKTAVLFEIVKFRKQHPQVVHLMTFKLVTQHQHLLKLSQTVMFKNYIRN